MRSNSKSGFTRLPFSVIELNGNVHFAEKKNNERKSIEIFFGSLMAVYLSLRSQFLKVSQFVVYLLAYLAD